MAQNQLPRRIIKVSRCSARDESTVLCARGTMLLHLRCRKHKDLSASQVCCWRFVDEVVGFFSCAASYLRICANCAAPGISASPSEDNLRYFNVMILGPHQSCYEGMFAFYSQGTPCYAAWPVPVACDHRSPGSSIWMH